MITRMTRDAYVAAATPTAGSREMAAAELDVYCPEHGGYRDECQCPAPGLDSTVTVDSRFVPWTPPGG